jgi:hypothetical protein
MGLEFTNIIVTIPPFSWSGQALVIILVIAAHKLGVFHFGPGLLLVVVVAALAQSLFAKRNPRHKTTKRPCAYQIHHPHRLPW